MEKKYELIALESKDKRTVYRIKALKSFGNVKAGDIGGVVDGEDNLSQEGDCWIDESSVAINKSVVKDNAIIIGNSMVYDNAIVGGNAILADSALVGGYAEVYDDMYIGRCDTPIVVGIFRGDGMVMHNNCMSIVGLDVGVFEQSKLLTAYKKQNDDFIWTIDDFTGNASELDEYLATTYGNGKVYGIWDDIIRALLAALDNTDSNKLYLKQGR